MSCSSGRHFGRSLPGERSCLGREHERGVADSEGAGWDRGDWVGCAEKEQTGDGPGRERSSRRGRGEQVKVEHDRRYDRRRGSKAKGGPPPITAGFGAACNPMDVSRRPTARPWRPLQPGTPATTTASNGRAMSPNPTTTSETAAAWVRAKPRAHRLRSRQRHHVTPRADASNCRLVARCPPFTLPASRVHITGTRRDAIAE